MTCDVSLNTVFNNKCDCYQTTQKEFKELSDTAICNKPPTVPSIYGNKFPLCLSFVFLLKERKIGTKLLLNLVLF